LPYGFRDALIRLIEAFSDAEDPVALLVASAQKHIHLNTASVGLTSRGSSHIPDTENREPIDGIIEELQEQKWYVQQIKYRRTFDAKEGTHGRCGENNMS
jgi:DEAD/DEAH box helicase domain-containing protein